MRNQLTNRDRRPPYMRWLEEVRGAKRSSLRDRESMLVEPGTLYRRGEGKVSGHVMAAMAAQGRGLR